MNLESLLQATFGFAGFRANQEAVCCAATEGRDVLLVMPTGAGKSLCYQLPAIARGGPALVISPLIALMDDQAAKLSALGLRVARIHSGLAREQSRQACQDYLSGSLNFLFIAPERMRVPGFPQMLAKRTPSLVAIDEAHCISAWGHDFRPDYRTLGEHLPALRPAPIVALTATATPTVQRDIAAQLQLRDPALFIHGFRRGNLAIEVVEMSKPRRHEFTATLLSQASRRPAIVYAPSRKAAEELAGELGRSIKTAAYHAGLDAGTRERVQTAFLAGKLEVVVATIAFGMGIDKADVRTVIHTALPASVEAFYQEIGRAGRDGLPSRTVLLHSFADRKMHEFFLDRDYPPVPDLARVARALTDEFLMPEPLARELKMDPGQFQKAIEKLVAQGAASIDVAGNVRRTATFESRGTAGWRDGYEAQITFRRAQLDAIAAFAETPQCRMAALIRHFGDTGDGLRPCGQCDVCAPGSTEAQQFREPDATEARHLRAILAALRSAPFRSTGKLYTDLALPMERRAFDSLLDALTRAGLVTLSSETFTTPEGRIQPYKKAALTFEGRAEDAADLTGVLLAESGQPGTERRSSSRSKSTATRTRRNADAPVPVTLTAAQQQLEQELRAWRKAEAAKTGKPAFIVCGDAVLVNIAVAQPRTIPELLTIPGIGPNKAETYGAAILALCRADSSTTILAIVDRAPEQRTSFRTSPISSPLVAASQRTPSTVANSGSGLKHRREKKVRKSDHRLSQRENQLIDLQMDLRAFLKIQSELLSIPAGDLLSQEAILEIATFQPRTQTDLAGLQNLRGDLPFTFYQALLQTCCDAYRPEPEPIKIRERHCDPPKRAIRERTSSIQQYGEPTPTYRRESSGRPDPAANLTPDQQALDLRLRDWRKAESERLGLPLFFVMASSTLRGIVLARPESLDALRGIEGLDPEKLRQFGPAIVELCTT